MKSHFDAIVVGAGQAGPALAARLIQAGQKVAVVERKLFGGTCVNTGCTPTKAMVASARAIHQARRGAEFGFTAGAITVDLSVIMSRKDGIVAKSRDGVEKSLRELEGCTVFHGQTAHFLSQHEMQVGDNVFSADTIFLNVGGRATIPDLPGLSEISYLDNTTLLQLTELPKHLAIIGGGYISLEFAQMFRRFGSDVTIVEMGPRLVSHEDADVSEAVRQILEGEGIELRLNSECISFSKAESGTRVHMSCTHGAPELIASHVLIATGRTPNTGDLQLDKANIATDKHGYIVVDEQLQTSASNIYALGDCNGRGAFTHTAYNDFEIVAANLLDGGHRRVSDRIQAHALYIDPPLAQVGMTEAQVRQAGIPALTATRPMTRVNRAIEKGESQGFMKVLVHAETLHILGASILGTGGDEAIHSILDTMICGSPYTTLRDAVHIHPTVSELIPTLLGDLKPLPPG